MSAYRLITKQQLADFAAAISEAGWREQDFDLQEDVFDPVRAETEASAGAVGVRCVATEAVQIYPLGPAFTWADDFAADLRAGKFGRPSK